MERVDRLTRGGKGGDERGERVVRAGRAARVGGLGSDRPRRACKSETSQQVLSFFRSRDKGIREQRFKCRTD